MLVDTITIHIKAGNGGNGSVHFLRNAKTSRGGPDGGNGGNGGNIYVTGVDDITALQVFRYKKRIEAENGGNGGRQNMFGRNGKHMTIALPIGTHITDILTGKEWEVTHTTSHFMIAHGGIGGRGNNEFKSATNQAPRFAEKGTPGEQRDILLQLKLIADIGLIGLPNAGKSSLLGKLTNAHPKVGDYPFTTLEPNLGVMEGSILADIPGLIEGASLGKGLGIKFLAHIEKTRVLIHCIASDMENIISSYKAIRTELGAYNTTLLSKPEIILLTKSDLVSPQEAQKKMRAFKKAYPQQTIMPVTIFNPLQLKEVKQTILSLLHTL